MVRRYTCSDVEWEFARYHSFVRGVDGGNKGFGCASMLITPIVFFGVVGLYYLLRWILPDSMEPAIIWLKELSVVIGIIAGVIGFLRPIYIPIGDTGELEGGRVAYLLTDEQGIRINSSKTLDPKVLAYWQWSSIEKITIDITRDLTPSEEVPYCQSRKEDVFQTIRARCPAFQEEARKQYEDRFTIKIETTRKLLNTVTWIQIPRSWLMDGQFIALLGEIEKYTNLHLLFFNEEARRSFLEWERKQSI